MLVMAACGGGGAPSSSDAPLAGDSRTVDAPPARLVAYVSGYSTEIARFDVTRDTGGLVPAETITAFDANTSFLAVDPASAHLYAVSESTSRVGAYAIDPATGALSSLNDVASGGNGPAHVSVDRSGATVLVANYGD